jgi:flagellin-like protein
MKGVSPLIAVVLLIAIAFGIGLMINDWIRNVIVEILEESTQKYTETIGCLKSSFKVLDYSLSNQTLSGMIENTGEYDLQDFRIGYLMGENFVLTSLDLNVSKGRIKGFSSQLLFTPEKIRMIARSEVCPST